MFKVTPAAAAQVLKAERKSGAEGLALRLAANKQADGSINYVMGFDEAAEDDISFKSEGVDIVIKPEFVPLLDQATLDFVKLEQGDFQFIFLNPLDSNYTPPSEA